MKSVFRVLTSLLLVFAFLATGLPCGPSYVTPLFDTSSAPEAPFRNFAAGELGIIKPKFRRSVLYAAYRHIAGNGLSKFEQDALVQVWEAEVNIKAFEDNSIDDAVRAWIKKRKDVLEKEDALPNIYVERPDEGYDFFPNCTKNAFETATETLADRASVHGPSDKNVADWIKAQDQVFENCSSGKTTPPPAPVGAPGWLQKDRDYQLAAAAFYSLDFPDAKRRFQAIAQDADSPWQETADYLVARTLVRQASLSKDDKKSDALHGEAETHLQTFVSRSGKFTAAAERLMGLIAYRRHPKERVSELAKKLTYSGGGENFRQDVIDYNWLLDKFEAETLNEEERRKESAKPVADPNANSPATNAPVVANAVGNAVNTVANAVTTSNSNASTLVHGDKGSDDDVTIYLSSEDYQKNWVLYLDANATDAEALAAAEKLIGAPLTEEQKKRVTEGRRHGYSERFSGGQRSNYEGGHYGDEKLTRSLLPAFLRQDDLSDWLFTYQMSGAEAYLYSLKKYRESDSELWLMTALSKAEKTSTDLTRLIEAGQNASRTSVAFPTIAYQTVRVLIELGKTAEARKLLDEVMAMGDRLPITAQNAFTAQKLTLAETLEDFLKYSLRRAYAFDFEGTAQSIDDLIAEQKSWYDPDQNKEGRPEYEAEIDETYKFEKLWQDRLMFDSESVDQFNHHFSTQKLHQAMHSPAMPEYMRERFAVAVWVRAYLLGDDAMLATLTPELAVLNPEFAPFVEKIMSAKSPAARENAQLHFIIKNPVLTPYIEDGMGKIDNISDQFDSNDWWCEPYDNVYSDETNEEVPRALPPRPKFLTAAQTQQAQAERKRIKALGDAPKYLAGKVLSWAKRYPTDRRVPEMLYLMIGANGWTKYQCGNNEELREQMLSYLRKHYPDSEWLAKFDREESEKN